MERQPAVYVLASKRNGTLYIGVTSDLIARVWQHRTDAVTGFTRRYCVHMLVYYELHSTMYDAITREKQLKKWSRAWKLRLIEKANPDWTDLVGEDQGITRPVIAAEATARERRRPRVGGKPVSGNGSPPARG